MQNRKRYNTTYLPAFCVLPHPPPRTSDFATNRRSLPKNLCDLCPTHYAFLSHNLHNIQPEKWHQPDWPLKVSSLLHLFFISLEKSMSHISFRILFSFTAKSYERLLQPLDCIQQILPKTKKISCNSWYAWWPQTDKLGCDLKFLPTALHQKYPRNYGRL